MAGRDSNCDTLYHIIIIIIMNCYEYTVYTCTCIYQLALAAGARFPLQPLGTSILCHLGARQPVEAIAYLYPVTGNM